MVNGPLTRYVKLRFAHAPGMPGTFPAPPRISVPDMHHGTCVTHMPWCMPGSLTSDFLGSRWWGNRSWHSRRMHNPLFYVSGKRPMWLWWVLITILQTEFIRRGYDGFVIEVTYDDLITRHGSDSPYKWPVRFGAFIVANVNRVLNK